MTEEVLKDVGKLEILTTKEQKVDIHYSISSGLVRVERHLNKVLLPQHVESQSVSFLDVIWAGYEDEHFELSFLGFKKCFPKSRVLVTIKGKVLSAKQTTVDEWCSEVMAAAYKDIKTQRRLRVWVNPHSGKGKSTQIFNVVRHVFEAARCDYAMTYTGHSKHAYEEAKVLPVDKFDAVVIVSGDGLIHEVLNGFAEHANAEEVLAIPIVPIGAGSGNAAALNFLGLEYGLDPSLAALNAIKGRPIKQDACCITQGDKKIYSFLSIATGLMADLDIGSEWMRFVGDARFLIAFFVSVLKFYEYPFNLYIKVDEDDKNKMIDCLKVARDGSLPPPNKMIAKKDKKPRRAPPASLLPPLPDRGDNWIKFDKPILYIYAGLQPYVSRDLMQFPVSIPSDGKLDIVVQERTTRMDMLAAADGSSKGDQFYSRSQHYYKTKSIYLAPKSKSLNLMIDGEVYPSEPIEVTVLQGFMTFMSMHGTFAYDPNFGN